MEKITGRENPHVKELVRLNASSRERREKGLFLVEGLRLCSEAIQCGAACEVLFTSEIYEKNRAQIDLFVSRTERAVEISGQVSEKISDTQTPQGIFCVCRTFENTPEIKKTGKYLLLENIQNPSNIGAICRTAEALGIDGIIVGGGCDIYNPKAQRAAMGSLFRINVFEIENTAEKIKEFNGQGMLTVVTTPGENSKDINDIDFSKGAVCVIGNEGNGATSETLEVCAVRAKIPMKGNAESLNASVAAAIVAWEMMR